MSREPDLEKLSNRVDVAVRRMDARIDRLRCAISKYEDWWSALGRRIRDLENAVKKMGTAECDIREQLSAQKDYLSEFQTGVDDVRLVDKSDCLAEIETRLRRLEQIRPKQAALPRRVEAEPKPVFRAALEDLIKRLRRKWK